MSDIHKFIDNMHPLTLQYFEMELYEQLKKIDKLNKMQTQIDEMRELLSWLNRTHREQGSKPFGSNDN